LIPFLTALPLTTKITAATIAFSAVFLLGGYYGNKIGASSCHEAVQAAQEHTIETGIKQAVVSDQTVTKYVDRVQIVQGKSRTIIKEIPVYVQDTVNLSGGWRMLHDNAVYNAVSDTTRDSDEATVKAQSVTATDALETVIRNYGICHENSTTLSSLQEWVREQSLIR
jgi:hypothetical protein